ncbi:MAG: carbohydrate-binding protein, partial [Burkholderiales bacterium]|nr:carbohydrate-binding protein [Burkholderiales bacterium]
MKLKKLVVLRLLPIAFALSYIGAAQAANTCAAWVGSEVYTQGNYSLAAGKTWRAKWWTQNEQPGANQWGPWEERPASECGVTPPDGGGGTGGDG